MAKVKKAKQEMGNGKKPTRKRKSEKWQYRRSRAKEKAGRNQKKPKRYKIYLVYQNQMSDGVLFLGFSNLKSIPPYAKRRLETRVSKSIIRKSSASAGSAQLVNGENGSL